MANKLACRSENTENAGFEAVVSVVPARCLSTHINQYLRELPSLCSVDSALAYWEKNKQSRLYSILPMVAQDLISAPSSQAFVERVFSTCGLMTSGRRNRMEKSLEMRVWLKANHDMLVEIIGTD